MFWIILIIVQLIMWYLTFFKSKKMIREKVESRWNGDVLWQLSGLCSVMGWSLDDIAQMNLDKLAARKAVGTIDGDGDGILRNK